MPNPVFERIEHLLHEQNKTQQSLLAQLRMKRSTYSSWKSGKSESYMKRIDGIAEFFDVSPNYLLRGIEDISEPGTQTPIEDELLRLFRKLCLRKQECLVQVARTLVLDEDT